MAHSVSFKIFQGNYFIVNKQLTSLGGITSLFASRHSYNNNNNNSYSSLCAVNHPRRYIFEPHDAFYLFKGLMHSRPLASVVKFTQFLDASTKSRLYSFSIDCFKQMCAIGVPVNKYTACIVIKCYCRLYDTQLGFSVLGSCFKQGIEPHVSTYNTLLNGFIRQDQTHEAEKLFIKLIQSRLWEPDVVTYNTMIKGLCKIGNTYTAIGLLRLMDGRLGGCKPDVVTFNTIIDSLCCIHIVIMMDDALKLFNEMIFHQAVQPDVHTYNALICGLCKFGRWDWVCWMLTQMEDECITPDVKTFNIIVDALCNQFNVCEAMRVINIMSEMGGKYLPDIVTYNSLIDGFSLQGEMSMAESVYGTLEYEGIKPNAVTYNKLLDGYVQNFDVVGGYLMHNNLFVRGSKPRPNMVAYHIATMGKLCDLWDRRRVEYIPFYEIQLEDKGAYKTALHHPDNTYEDALDLFHFMDGKDSQLNSDIGVYNFIIDCASKCGKLDIARRLFRDIFLKGLEPDIETYAVMIEGLCKEGILKDAKQLLAKMNMSGYSPNDVIINDLIQGYLRNKPFDDLVELLKEIRGSNYKLTLSTLRFFFHNLYVTKPENTSSRLKDQVMPTNGEICL